MALGNDQALQGVLGMNQTALSILGTMREVKQEQREEEDYNRKLKDYQEQQDTKVKAKEYAQQYNQLIQDGTIKDGDIGAYQNIAIKDPSFNPMAFKSFATDATFNSAAATELIKNKLVASTQVNQDTLITAARLVQAGQPIKGMNRVADLLNNTNSGFNVKVGEEVGEDNKGNKTYRIHYFDQDTGKETNTENMSAQDFIMQGIQLNSPDMWGKRFDLMYTTWKNNSDKMTNPDPYINANGDIVHGTTLTDIWTGKQKFMVVGSDNKPVESSEKSLREAKYKKVDKATQNALDAWTAEFIGRVGREPSENEMVAKLFGTVPAKPSVEKAKDFSDQVSLELDRLGLKEDTLGTSLITDAAARLEPYVTSGHRAAQVANTIYQKATEDWSQLIAQGKKEDTPANRRNFLNGVLNKTISEYEQGGYVPSAAIEQAKTAIGAPSETDMVEKGNIDLTNRPIVKNKDGSISTVRSISISTDKGEVLIPTVIDGKVVSEKDAIAHYKKTGEHLGIFKTEKAANDYAEKLHKQQAEYAKEQEKYRHLRTGKERIEKAGTFLGLGSRLFKDIGASIAGVQGRL